MILDNAGITAIMVSRADSETDIHISAYTPQTEREREL